MPRARSSGKLVRIPVPADVAYDVTYGYPPELDRQLIETSMSKWSERDRNYVISTFLRAIKEGKELNPKQRLSVLKLIYPLDPEIKRLQTRIENCSNPKADWGKAFRANPQEYYEQECTAVCRAIRRRMDETRAAVDAPVATS
jgi:hypothetical protein